MDSSDVIVPCIWVIIQILGTDCVLILYSSVIMLMSECMKEMKRSEKKVEVGIHDGSDTKPGRD